MAYRITASLVTYHNDWQMLEKTIQSFLNTSLDVHLFISDNSADKSLEEKLPDDSRISYHFNGANLGFGKAHNKVIKAVLENSDFHLILNPDIDYKDFQVLENLIQEFEKDEKVGAVMPRVVYPNNEIQYLAKLLPNPFDLIFRRFLPFLANPKFDLSFTGYAKTMEVPFISGCYMLVKTQVFKEVGLFDESFFMYCEDLDLSRRIRQKFKTLFSTSATVVHHYEKGSYKNKRLLKIHIQSAFHYFNKWGWFFDKERKKVNKETLRNLR